MKLCNVPTDLVLDLGYRKLSVKAGSRYYSDEVANAMPQYVSEPEPDPEPVPDPDPEPEPAPVAA